MPPSSFLNYALSLRPATLNILYSEGLPNNPSLNPLTPPTPAAADVFSKTILSTLPNLLPRGNWACRTILSTLLSTQERVLVLRLSVLPSPATVTEPTFRSWFTNAAPTLNYLAEGVSLPKLVRLAIITVSDDPNTAGFITLQTPFHSQLRLAIASTQQSPWKKPGEYSCATSSPGNDLTTDEGDTTSAETGVDPQALELYTQARWDEILHYLGESIGRGDDWSDKERGRQGEERARWSTVCRYEWVGEVKVLLSMPPPLFVHTVFVAVFGAHPCVWQSAPATLTRRPRAWCRSLSKSA